MRETYQNRECYLAMLSALEKLSDLYIRKPKPETRLTRALRSRKWLVSMLKPLARKIGKKKTPMKTPAGDLNINGLTAGERAPLYFSNLETVVYTVLFGAVDRILDPLVFPDNIHYFIITDQDLPENSPWKKIDASASLPAEIADDPVLCSRWYKMHPEILFPEFEASIYIDANILVTSDLTPLTAGLDQFPFTMFRHRTRDCAYQEIQACLAQKKASRQNLMMDKKRLEERALPEHWGLLEAPVIVRKHNDPLCRRIMDEWWKDFCEGASRRDQIALMDCLWQLQIPPEQIGILGSDVRATRLYIQLPHVMIGGKP